ncbi:MAG: FAD:protein FMN transferase [Marinilabiliaceae bacterium]
MIKYRLKPKHLSTTLLFVLILLSSCTPEPSWIKNEGGIFGTSYHIIYQSPDGKDLHADLKAALDSVNRSLSTYDSTSVISQFNKSSRGTIMDDHFRTVFFTAQKVTEKTEGAFDMTVAPLVNAWGFGFTGQEKVARDKTDSLKSLVGMDQIEIQDDSLIKHKPGIMLDASAIAKGYGSDVAAKVLERNGCERYMVEIGGEVVTKGKNSRNGPWRLGIDRPIDDPTASKRELELVVELSGQALATSGNYRQFYVDEETGKKYSHTIDPSTGRPVDHTLLSASVVAPSCMLADAYATAFMVMGHQKSLEIIKKHPELEGCFIFDSKDGMKVEWTEGFEQYVSAH